MKSAQRIVSLALAAAGPCALALGQEHLRGIPESRPDGESSVSLFFFVCLLLADYLWTFLFIGWPAISSTTLRIREMALEILWITLWSQPAALLPTLLVRVLEPGAFRFLAHSFLGGASVGLVIWHFARRRWGLSRGWSWILTLIGASLLNPASGGYALAYLF